MAGVENVNAQNIAPERADLAMPPPAPLADRARGGEIRDRMSARAEIIQRELTKGLDVDIQDLVDGLNVIARDYKKGLRFQIYQETGDVFAQVIDAETGEVIRTVPPLALLRTLARISDAVGLLLDEQA